MLRKCVKNSSHGSATSTPITLNLTHISLEQITDQGEKKIYYFKDLDAVVEGEEGVFALRKKLTERLVSEFTNNFLVQN